MTVSRPIEHDLTKPATVRSWLALESVLPGKLNIFFLIDVVSDMRVGCVPHKVAIRHHWIGPSVNDVLAETRAFRGSINF